MLERETRDCGTAETSVELVLFSLSLIVEIRSIGREGVLEMGEGNSSTAIRAT